MYARGAFGRNNSLDKEWDFDGFTAVFYDYFQPELVGSLEENEIVFTKCTLDFSISDATI